MGTGPRPVAAGDVMVRGFGEDTPSDPNSITVMKYPGAKWNLANWIIANMPSHRVYVEPFFGSGAVFFSKEAAAVEVLNDRDDLIVNLFKVIRDRPEELIRAVVLTPVAKREHTLVYDEGPTGDPIEDARRLLVKSWFSFGGRMVARSGFRRNFTANRSTVMDWTQLPERIAAVVERLRGASIECEDATHLIGRFKDKGTLIYADPPYPFEVRSDTIHDKYYRCEMGKAGEHLALLDALDAHPGMVILSGYRCELYDNRLEGWRRVDRKARVQMGEEKTESIWLNKAAADRAGYQLTIFDILGEDDG